MGAFLLTAGTAGKRMSLPSARITPTAGGAQGQAVDIEIQAKEILYHKRQLNELLAHHTGKPLERLKPILNETSSCQLRKQRVI